MMLRRDTDATEPVPTVDPSPIQAVKAVAVYDENGRLKSITSEDIVIQNPNDIEIEPVDGAVEYISGIIFSGYEAVMPAD